MMEDYTQLERIDFYLKGKLSKEERIAFTHEYNKDESLRQLVETQRLANEVIYTQQLVRLRSRIHKDLKNQNRFGSTTWMLLSCGVLLLAGVFWFVLKPEDKQVVKDNVLSMKKEAVPFTTNEQVAVGSFSSTKVSNGSTRSTETITKPTNASTPVMDTLEKNNADVPTEVATTNTIAKLETPAPLVSEKTAIVDCGKLSLELAVTTFPTCIGDQNGKIEIQTSKIKGGKEPYLFSISSRATFKNEVNYLYLNAGTYSVSVKDNNGCIAQKEVTIEEKRCASNTIYAFSPDLEEWKIPVVQNKQGEIKIVNKSGILVYQSKIGSGYENTWNGKSMEGKTVEPGYFIYSISYTDGEEEKGSVTVR
jgi:hypothetical protein